MSQIPEREPQTHEKVNLRERGGLTPAHWQDLIERIGQPGDEIVGKVVQYAQRVVAGDYPDSGFHHRYYLGARHWDVVELLPYSKKVERPGEIRIFPPRLRLKEYEIVYNEMALDTHNFASRESSAIFSLNDYIHFHPGRILVHTPMEQSELEWSGNHWGEIEREYGPANYERTGAEWMDIHVSDRPAVEYTHYILNHFLLTTDDVRDVGIEINDVAITPPKQLGLLLLAKARLDPEGIKPRLPQFYFKKNDYKTRLIEELCGLPEREIE